MNQPNINVDVWVMHRGKKREYYAAVFGEKVKLRGNYADG
jgi:hypothetical protein